MMATTATSNGSSILGLSRSGTNVPGLPILGSAQFREIHKNTWLKRLTAEGKKITVGPKKSERSWVVFCVHDDTEAILEGYAEPRHSVSHNPEWFVSMQNTQHISHALIPNSNEFEFVITLSNEVVRFHAMSWEIMQEWVDTLRSKLREMKILSPRENLYTKLPEARPPLLPTRDPTSPLPAPPPVPAAIVPGVELVVPQSMLQTSTTPTSAPPSSDSSVRNANESVAATQTNTTVATTSTTSTQILTASATQTTMTMAHHAMSNTLSQNLLNMLSDPISAYSEQLQTDESSSLSDDIGNVIVHEQLSTSLNDLQQSSTRANEIEDCLSPLLRQVTGIDSSLRNDGACVNIKRLSTDLARNAENIVQSERSIPRPHSSRSQSVGAADKNRSLCQSPLTTSIVRTSMDTNKEIQIRPSKTNITALEITTAPTTMSPIPILMSSKELAESSTCEVDENTATNITIIQVSTDMECLKSKTQDDQLPKLPLKTNFTQAAEIFKFPETIENEISNITTSKTCLQQKNSDYKTNVQLIPSINANSSTIKVLGDVSSSNQYSSPTKKPFQSQSQQSQLHQIQKQKEIASNSLVENENNQITTVHVGGTENTASVAVYGTCYGTPQPLTTPISTPKLPKKIILSANTSGITNITVDSNTHSVPNNLKSKNKLENNSDLSARCNIGNVHYEKVFLSSSMPTGPTVPVAAQTSLTNNNALTTPAVNTYVSSPTSRIPHSSQEYVSPIRQSHGSPSNREPNLLSSSTSVPSVGNKKVNKSVQTTPTPINVTPKLPTRPGGSPALQRRVVALRPSNMLTRGQTEAVITARPSRRDFHSNNSRNNSTRTQTSVQQSNKPNNRSQNIAVNNNENGEASVMTEATNPLQTTPNRSLPDAFEQRRRSSSTSDARPQRSTRGANNNEFNVIRSSNALRIQQPPQPFRNMENSLIGGATSMTPQPSGISVSKRMTLREQQIMQLRREIMHPGGVRLQLRRKDCIGSIAFVEAFGAVWIAGWKQKEHPVLYNALHIGDQLLSIAGVTISSPAEANKIIRNANTLFVEVLIRRMPFGRGYAIRRDREGQCLGLIRDGNTSTIVDVVPNSLAARNGLPPKAQSCDGTSLTFWVLTEINGRPLNLFFKETEIRDRLNSVGRDISILVQPSDLIAKLKKQLKSLRGYKDYLLQ